VRGQHAAMRALAGARPAAAYALCLGACVALIGCGATAAETTVRSERLTPLLSPTATSVAREGGSTPRTVQASNADARSSTRASAPSPLAGRVIAIDPGHNGGNFTHPQQIARLVNDGNGTKECDTTGTAAPDGYREADFNWSVALDLRALLAAAGAHVVMTRQSNTGVGPCVNERAAIGNRARSNVALSIHADGGPPGGSGFAVLVPAPIPSRDDQGIVAPSRRFGYAVREALISVGLHPSTYDGVNGIAPRTDLGGLNLSRVPKVLVEVANMQNARDEAPMERASYRKRVARGLREAIERFLAGS
jgi:N-acetylmuramoyl-L-alanine amidase